MRRAHGIRQFTPTLQDGQVEWLLVSAADCPNSVSERRFVAAYFRRVHEPWGPQLAFVLPVQIRRTRLRVLFRQESGTLDL